MIDQSVASADAPAYVERGRWLFAERWADFEYCGGRRWYVPSGSVEGRVYEVDLRSRRCECIGHYHHGHCSHVVAASMAQAKSTTCSCCHRRVLRRLTTEVREENYDGLCWFVGDHLCGDCVKAGFWS